MKSIVFDSGPIISLAMNNLLWILEPLKKKYRGEFFMPTAVKGEVVDRPLETKIYKFEALQVDSLVRKGIFKLIYNNEINSLANHLLSLANNSFEAQGNPINIIQYGEMQAVASAIFLDSDAIVVDERITRIMVENPPIAAKILGNKLHTPIRVNEENVEEFTHHTRKIRVLRSVELASMAFELGLLDGYLPKEAGGRKTLLDSVLWALKLKGCSVSENEIGRIMKLEKV
jgi:hypothetical protein